MNVVLLLKPLKEPNRGDESGATKQQMGTSSKEIRFFSNVQKAVGLFDGFPPQVSLFFGFF